MLKSLLFGGSTAKKGTRDSKSPGTTGVPGSTASIAASQKQNQSSTSSSSSPFVDILNNDQHPSLSASIPAEYLSKGESGDSSVSQQHTRRRSSQSQARRRRSTSLSFPFISSSSRRERERERVDDDQQHPEERVSRVRFDSIVGIEDAVSDRDLGKTRAGRSAIVGTGGGDSYTPYSTYPFAHASTSTSQGREERQRSIDNSSHPYRIPAFASHPFQPASDLAPAPTSASLPLNSTFRSSTTSPTLWNASTSPQQQQQQTREGVGLGFELAELEPWRTGSLPPPPRSPSSSWSKKRRTGSLSGNGNGIGSGSTSSHTNATTTRAAIPARFRSDAELTKPASIGKGVVSQTEGASNKEYVAWGEKISPTLYEGFSGSRGSTSTRPASDGTERRITTSLTSPQPSSVISERQEQGHRRRDSAPATTLWEELELSLQSTSGGQKAFVVSPQRSTKRDSLLSAFSSTSSDTDNRADSRTRGRRQLSPGKRRNAKSAKKTASPTSHGATRQRTISRLSSIFKARDPTPGSSLVEQKEESSRPTRDQEKGEDDAIEPKLASVIADTKKAGGSTSGSDIPTATSDPVGQRGSKLWKKTVASTFRRPSLAGKKSRALGGGDDISEDYVEINAEDVIGADPPAFRVTSSPQRRSAKEDTSRRRVESSASRKRLDSVVTSSTATSNSRSRLSSSTSATSSLIPRSSKSNKTQNTALTSSTSASAVGTTTVPGKNMAVHTLQQQQQGGPARSVSLSGPSLAASAKVREAANEQRALNAATMAQGSSRQRRTSAAPALASTYEGGSGSTIGRSAGSQILRQGGEDLQQVPNKPSYDIAAVLEDAGVGKASSSSLRKRAQSDASKAHQQRFPSTDDAADAAVVEAPARTSRFASLKRFMRSGSRTKSTPTHPSELPTSVSASVVGQSATQQLPAPRQRTRSEARPSKPSAMLAPLRARDPPENRAKKSRASGDLQEVQEFPSESESGDAVPAPTRPTQAAMERVQQGKSKVEGLPSSSLEILRSQTPTTSSIDVPGLPALAQDRSLTLQALQASPSKHGKSSLMRPSSANTASAETDSTGHAPMQRRPSGSSNSSSLGMGLALGGGMNGSTEILSSIGPGRQPSRLPGFVSAPNAFGPQPSIPKMWTAADAIESRPSREASRERAEKARQDDALSVPAQSSSIRSTGAYRRGSSVITDGTAASWRTAPSSVNGSPDRPTRNLPLASDKDEQEDGALRRSPELLPIDSRIGLVPESMLHLNHRANNSHSEENDSSVDIRREIERLERSPAIAAGPSPEPVLFPAYATGSSSHDTGAASYGSPSVVSTPQVVSRKRNTFGGTESLSRGMFDSPSSTTGYTSASRPTRHGELSLSEIESNLAVIEAALNDHSLEGSFDPTNLRRRLGSPETNSGSGTRFTSSVSNLESPERITLRPQSHEAIAMAVREVRRALSGTHLSRRLEGHPETVEESEGGEIEELATTSFGNRSTQENTPARNARNRQLSMREVEEIYSRMVNLVTASAGIAPSPMPQNDAGIAWPKDEETPSRPGRYSGEAAALQSEPLTRQASEAPSTPPPEFLQSRRNTLVDASVDESAIDPSIFGRGTDFDGEEAESVRAAGRKRSSGGSTSNRGTSNTSPSMAVKTQGTPHSPMGNANRSGEFPGGRRSADQRSIPSQPRSSLEARRTSFDRLQNAIQETRIPEEGSAVLMGRDGGSLGHESRYRSSSRASLMRASPGPTSFASVLRQSLDGNPTRPRHSSEVSRSLSRYSALDGIPHRPLNPVLDDLADSQTVGTSIFGSPSSSQNLASLQRRHNLEKNSLLDALERAKSEADQYRQQNEQLRSDLHQEVARLLELERAFEQGVTRQNELQSKVERLEDQLRAEHEARIDLLDKLERISALWPASGEVGAEDESATASAVDSQSQHPTVGSGLSASASAPTTKAMRDMRNAPPTGSKARASRVLSSSPIMTTRILDDDIIISSDDEADTPAKAVERDEPQTPASKTRKKGASREHELRSYASELGLHIDSQEMSWGNLVDETPPADDSRSSTPEVNADTVTPSRHVQSDSSISNKVSDHIPPPAQPAEVEDDAAVSQPAADTASKLEEEAQKGEVAKKADTPSSPPVTTPSKKRRSGLPLPTAPTTTASVARTISSGSIAAEGRRVPGSLPGSMGSIRSAAQRASMTLPSTGSSATVTNSGAGGSRHTSRIPSISGTIPGSSSLRKVSAVSAATSGADSSFTTRSNSPVGQFVVGPGAKQGHYDPRRPEGYDPVAVPEGLKAIADDSIEEINAAGRD